MLDFGFTRAQCIPLCRVSVITHLNSGGAAQSRSETGDLESQEEKIIRTGGKMSEIPTCNYIFLEFLKCPCEIQLKQMFQNGQKTGICLCSSEIGCCQMEHTGHRRRAAIFNNNRIGYLFVREQSRASSQSIGNLVQSQN